MQSGNQTINTLGELKKSGWQSVPVKQEIRKNLVQKIQQGEELFPGILGYDRTVVPQLQNALLSLHDFVLLGLRGQAKTRMLRMLVHFLDEYMPVVAGSEINDDPYHPISKYARTRIQEEGDRTPIEWVHRNERYSEKLATPDTSVADLVGDVDPIKAASRKLTLADEDVIHFGLIPRTNRGIFVINELPDLQPRIQVALLNIMHERDIQIRGFNIRIPLDVMMSYSANPEDYTNRGAIITPLKDRIDSQIITHYPQTLETGMQITAQEAWMQRNGQVQVHVPDCFREVIDQVAFEARSSEFVDQKSGVSTRLTITAMEHVASSAERRALASGEKKTVVRVADLYHMVPAITGKIELVYEGEQEGAINVAKMLIGQAITRVFASHFPDPRKKREEQDNPYREIVSWFAQGHTVDLPDWISERDYKKKLNAVEGLKKVVEHYCESAGQAERTVMMDFVLEALHQNSMLGKEDLDDRRSFSDMVGSMLGSVGGFGNEFGNEEDDSDDIPGDMR